MKRPSATVHDKRVRIPYALPISPQHQYWGLYFGLNPCFAVCVLRESLGLADIAVTAS